MKSPSQLRSTPVETRRADVWANPVSVFVDKDRLAFLWFMIAAISIAAAIAGPLLVVRAMKVRERVVVVDPARNYHISPLLNFAEAKELHAQQSTLAASALLDRNPAGFDQPELFKLMFLKFAHRKALASAESEKQEFKAKQLHQKAEIAEITILQTREDFVLTQVTGQLIRTGIFQDRAFSEAIPFKLSFKMIRNPDMTMNGRFPTAVRDFKYDPARYLLRYRVLLGICRNCDRARQGDRRDGTRRAPCLYRARLGGTHHHN